MQLKVVRWLMAADRSKTVSLELLWQPRPELTGQEPFLEMEHNPHIPRGDGELGLQI